MVTLRAYKPDDAPVLLALFRDTIRRVNARDYAPDQIRAWASDDIDPDHWAIRVLSASLYFLRPGRFFGGQGDWVRRLPFGRRRWRRGEDARDRQGERASRFSGWGALLASGHGGRRWP